MSPTAPPLAPCSCVRSQPVLSLELWICCRSCPFLPVFRATTPFVVVAGLDHIGRGARPTTGDRVQARPRARKKAQPVKNKGVAVPRAASTRNLLCAGCADAETLRTDEPPPPVERCR